VYLFEHAFAITAGITGWRARFPDPPPGERTEGRGRLTTYRGWRVMHLEGLPHEMGLQHGRLLGSVIRDLHDVYMTCVRVWRGLRRSTLVRRGRRMEPHIPPHLIEEMHGIAEGADMPYDDVLVAHTFLESVEAVHCACYAAWGRATRDGELVFGRNLDFLSMGVAHRCQVLTFHKPDRGIPFVSIGWPGLCGTLTAVNLAGLCMGMLNVTKLQLGGAGQPYVITFRRMVQEAQSCDEAVDLLKATQRADANNVLLAQTAPERGAVVAEYTPREVVVRRPREGNEFIASTNHFRQLGRRAEWAEWRGHLRYPSLMRLLRKHEGRIGPDTDILADRNVHLPNSLHALVAAPERRTFRAALGHIPAAAGPYRAFAYDEDGIRQAVTGS
jgi:hypothetical protein